MEIRLKGVHSIGALEQEPPAAPSPLRRKPGQGRTEGTFGCPTQSVAADAIERTVAGQIRAVGRDVEVSEATLAAARARADGAEVDAEDLRRALALWDDVWSALTPEDQARVATLLIERVSYDGTDGKVALTLRPNAIRALAGEVRG